MEQKKTLQELTLLDRFLFDEAMEKPENMRAVLEIILGKEIVMKYLPQTEKEERVSLQFRFAKLDVWAQDESGNVYDTEVQKKNEENLPKRSRYYQSIIDSRLLKPGTGDFNELNPIFIIFITPFDPFRKGRYRYTFSMQCEEEPGIKLADGAARIFLNTHGEDEEHISPELRELLYFMEHTNDDATACKCERVAQLMESVREIQNNEEVAMRYLHELEEQNASRLEGRAEGTEATKRIFKLHIAGKSDEEISELCGVPLQEVEETLR